MASLRRSIADMDAEAVCLGCGHAMERQFSTTSNLFVPMHFRYTWSDFHDETEKELAKDPRIEKSERVFSGPGRNPR
jgi:hypothetical protein